MLLFFLLMFVGLSVSVLGLKYQETLFAIVGVIWALVTAYAFRAEIPLKALAGAFIGMLAGAGIGAGVGLAVGGVAESLAGVISGAVFGAMIGGILVGVVLGSLGVDIPVLPGISVGLTVELPARVTSVLLIVGVIGGGAVGAVALRETIIKVFGPVGAGALAVGGLGTAVGLLVGHRLTTISGPGLPEKDPATLTRSMVKPDFIADLPTPTRATATEPSATTAGLSTSTRRTRMSTAASEFREKIRRRAIVMDIGGFRPPDDAMASWFGTVCLGLPGEEWPTQDGKPMHALAQINLRELPFRPPRLSDIEFVTVFIGPSKLPIDTPNGEHWCLRTYQNIDALVPLEAVDSGSPIKAFPMCPRVIEEDFPCWEDLPCACPEGVDDKYYDLFENVPGFKLGGWPSLIQSEVHWAPWNGYSIRPEYVFQIDSTEKGHWAWADSGVGYFGRGTAEGHEDYWALAWQCF